MLVVAGYVNQLIGGQKQHGLDRCVHQHLEQGGLHPGLGANAKPQVDIANLRDGRVGNHAPDVPLADGHDGADDHPAHPADKQEGGNLLGDDDIQPDDATEKLDQHKDISLADDAA